MAEWKEVIHNVKRICVLREGKCGTCRLGAFGCPNNARFDMTDEKEFDKFAEEVMQWAKENPEPEYPTWGEYLHTLHNEPSSRELSKPIPADTAQKLGLEPRRQ